MNRNYFVRILSLILAVVILLNGSLFAAAASGAGDGEPVARLYVCSRKKSFFAMGHVFLYVENLSEKTLKIGPYDLPPREGVSIGTFGFTRADGFGVYFNVEAYVYNAYGDQGILCLSSNLTAKELEKFSSRLLYSNTWDFMFYNCVSFAFMMWDTVAAPVLIPLLIPALGRLQIRLYGGQAAPKMFYPSQNRVYKMRGSGKNSSLKRVSKRSISR